MAAIPFDYSFFFNAMVGLLGRKPNDMTLLGFDGFYQFLYVPADSQEEKLFQKSAATLREWLGKFKLTPIRSRCEYACFERPKADAEYNFVLIISIVLPVKKQKTKNKT